MPVPLVLASASPARLATLRSAGIEPRVMVSHVDEDAALEAARLADPALSAAGAALALARAKAREVAATNAPDALVLGCDSILEFDGQWLGKPGDSETARGRWRAMRGHTGLLHTGHWLVDARTPADRDEGGAVGGAAEVAKTAETAKTAEVGETASTAVWFASLSDAEIDAYVSTGEPLAVAGAFTIDGLGGPFVERIEGDHHTVVGLSLPLLRHLCASLGVGIPELWSRP